MKQSTRFDYQTISVEYRTLLSYISILALFLAACKKKVEEKPSPKPVVAFHFQQPLCTGYNGTFWNESQNATSYLWEFEDGMTSTAVNPQKEFDTYNKLYKVKLTATGPGGTNTITKDVYYLPDCIARVKFCCYRPSGVPFPDTITVEMDGKVDYITKAGTFDSLYSAHFFVFPGTYTYKATCNWHAPFEDSITLDYFSDIGIQWTW